MIHGFMVDILGGAVVRTAVSFELEKQKAQVGEVASGRVDFYYSA